MGVLKNLTGMRFGRLLVVSRAPDGVTSYGKRTYNWVCKCDCGGEKTVSSAQILKKARGTRSCGCLAWDVRAATFTTHGMTGDPRYIIRQSMLDRCYNENHKDYHNYGARGITVCSRWRYGDGTLTGLECIWLDMGPKPSPKHSLDRIDVNGPYSPDNCRWATPKEQAINRRNAVNLTKDGVTKSLLQWAEELGIGRDTLYSRVNRGMSDHDALTVPLRKRRTKAEMSND